MANPESKMSVAVLVSGGLDSAVLVGDLIRRRSDVFPIYVRTGSIWETVERAYLDRFLKAIVYSTLRPMVVLDQPMNDLYGEHWSNTGRAPDALAPDEDFYLPGRNVVLLSKPLIWCRLHNVAQLALGILRANPFPDATPQFFRSYSAIVNQATGGHIQVVTPYARLSKSDVIKIGCDMPLQHTFSCMSPVGERHCGRCGKCAERGRAFIAAGIADPTDYVSRQWEGTTQSTAHNRPWEK
jgi:7-cyano-7-deazaguanine synthase